MPVGYVSANSEVRKESLNEATADLDAILRVVFQGKSPLAYDDAADRTGGGFHSSSLFGEFFFFGASGLWKMIPEIFGAVSPYDHNTYTTAATSLIVDSFDEDKHLAVCIVDPWPLSGSLGVHTTDKDGVAYFLAQKGDDPSRPIAERERFRKLPVAEIVCESLTSLAWDSSWNRYHCLRFHNLSLVEMTVDLGTEELTIPPLGCKAVRRTYPAGSTWDTSYTYLWKWKAGDSACYSADEANNVGGIKVLHDWLDWLEYSTATAGYSLRDPASVWEPENNPFPAILDSRKLIEYILHGGRLMSWEIVAGEAVSLRDGEISLDELHAGTEHVELDYDAGTYTVTLQSTDATAYDVLGPGTTLAPLFPTPLPHVISVPPVMPSTGCPSAYDPMGPNPGYTSTYRNSRVDWSTIITVDTGDLPDHLFGNWYTNGQWLGQTTEDCLTGFQNDKTPAFGDELTPDPTLELKSDGFHLWLLGTHEFPATSREKPIGRGTDGGVPVKFWWTATTTTVSQSFGCDLADRDGWLHSTIGYGRHVLPFDGYHSGGDPVNEGNPDVSGTYGLDEGIDWREARTTHDTPTVKRIEDAQEVLTETLTLPVRPKLDSAERCIAEGADLEWYTANRTDLIAQTLDEDDEGTVVMYPILWSHFNHLAARLNGVIGISPFAFQHVIYWGDIDDATWPSEFNDGYPLDFYCSVSSTGSRAVELGLTRESITESSVTGYYVTITDVAAMADSLGLAMDVEGIISYKTQLIPPDLTGQYYWQWIHSNSASDYRCGYLDEIGIWAVSRRTISYEGYSIYSPGINRYEQKHIIDVQRSVNYPEIPAGWSQDLGSRLLCCPVSAVGFVNDPLAEQRVFELSPPAPVAAWGTEYEPLAVYDAADCDPKYLLIGESETEDPLPMPATHSTITTAMGTSADDRSEWHVSYMRRILIVRQ